MPRLGNVPMMKSAFILTCAVTCALASGLAVSKLDEMMTSDPDDSIKYARVESSATPTAAAYAQGGVTAIPKAADGHFWAEARVNTTTVRFLVDTGASVVALTPEDARRLGINLTTLVYDQEVSTAMGTTKAARVTIDSMGIGQSRMQDVEALVIREGLSTSLLGMSYLGRLSRFEATPRSLILHP